MNGTGTNQATQKIYLKQTGDDEEKANFQNDLKKVAFYASQFIDANKQKNECFSTLQALNSHFSDFQNQISEVASSLPMLTDEQREIMSKEEITMMKEMRSIQDKLRYDMHLSQNSRRETPEREGTISLRKEEVQTEAESPPMRVMLSNLGRNKSTLPSPEPYLSLWKESEGIVENILMRGGGKTEKKRTHRQKTVKGYR